MTRTGLTTISAVLAHLDGLDDTEAHDDLELDLLRDLVDLVRPGAGVHEHLHAISAEAGLGVMGSVFEVVIDRESMAGPALLDLSAQDIEDLYASHIAPAIDAIERDLLS